MSNWLQNYRLCHVIQGTKSFLSVRRNSVLLQGKKMYEGKSKSNGTLKEAHFLQIYRNKTNTTYGINKYTWFQMSAVFIIIMILGEVECL
jgi:hypothetical protein